MICNCCSFQDEPQPRPPLAGGGGSDATTQSLSSGVKRPSSDKDPTLSQEVMIQPPVVTDTTNITETNQQAKEQALVQDTKEIIVPLAGRYGDSSGTTTRGHSSGGKRQKRDDADIHGVYVLSINDDFQYSPATDSAIKQGTLIFGDLTYVYRAFSRSNFDPSVSDSPPLTYLSIFGVSTERTVRFRIQRGEFIPEQDLQAASIFLDTAPAPVSAGSVPIKSQWGVAEGNTATVNGGDVLQQLVSTSRPSSRSGKRDESMNRDLRYQDSSKTLMTAMTEVVEGGKVGGVENGAENDVPSTGPTKSLRRTVPILTGVCKLGGMTVIEEPKEYHVLAHTKPTPTSSSSSSGVGPEGNGGTGTGPSMPVVCSGTFLLPPPSVDGVKGEGAGEVCSYRAISHGNQTQVIVIVDEACKGDPSQRRKLYFTVDRSKRTSHPTLTHPSHPFWTHSLSLCCPTDVQLD